MKRLLPVLAGVFALKLVVLLQLQDHPLTHPDAGLDTTALFPCRRAGDLRLVHGGAGCPAFLTSAALYFLSGGILPPEGGSYRVGKRGRPVASAFRRKDLLVAGVVFGIQAMNRPNILLAAIGVSIVIGIDIPGERPPWPSIRTTG